MCDNCSIPRIYACVHKSYVICHPKTVVIAAWVVVRIYQIECLSAAAQGGLDYARRQGGTLTAAEPGSCIGNLEMSLVRVLLQGRCSTYMGQGGQKKGVGARIGD